MRVKIAQNNKTEDSDKTYFGGSDASVGFAVPANGGAPIAEPDPVIAATNANAEEQSKVKKYIPAIYRAYLRLPEDSQLRKQAADLEAEYLSLLDKRSPLLERDNERISAASRLRDKLHEFDQEFNRKYAAEWLNSSDAESVNNDITAFYNDWERTFTQLAEPFRIADLSSSLAAVLDNLGMANATSLSYIEETLDDLSGAENELYKATTQTPTTRLDKKLLALEDKIEQVQLEVHRALIESENSTRSTNGKSTKTLSIDEFRRTYLQLPEDSPIRMRAYQLEQRWLALYHQFNQLAAVDEKKQLKKKNFKELLATFEAEVRDLFNNWKGDSERAENFFAEWKGRLEACVDPYSISDFTLTLQRLDNWTTGLNEQTVGENSEKIYAVFYLINNELDQVTTEDTTPADEVRESILSIEQEMLRMYGDVRRVLELKGFPLIAQKSQMRLLQDIEEAEANKDVAAPASPTTPPTHVPNYRLAIDASPRVCGNCRFFTGSNGVNGNCSAFDFTARANYVCDAWQAQSLTSFHTAVRGIMDTIADVVGEATGNKPQATLKVELSPVIEIDGHPKVTEGVVPGEHQVPLPIGDNYTWALEEGFYQHNEDDGKHREIPREENLRNATRTFLPGDLVYSGALRSMAVIQKAAELEGLKVYALKLIDGNGNSWGSGISYGNDLTPRSKSAVKSDDNISTVYATDDLVEQTQTVYKALRAIVKNHENILENPLSNKEILTPLREDLIKCLSQDMFVGVKTGPKRKYYRAIQTALSSIGAARQVLFEGYNAIRTLQETMPANKSAMRQVMLKAQQDAYERVCHACKQLEDALMLPSATHNQAAPGLIQDLTGE